MASRRRRIVTKVMKIASSNTERQKNQLSTTELTPSKSDILL